jgi:hypothetical protein
MKWWKIASLVGYCAIASFGCDSETPGKELLGSYTVQITTQGKSDPDVMTVSPGTGGALLFTFIVGITTDATGDNANGLRADLSNSTNISIAAQPVNIDHSTGFVSGTTTGEGTLTADGTCDVFLHFTASGGAAAQDYEIVGTRQ